MTTTTTPAPYPFDFEYVRAGSVCVGDTIRFENRATHRIETGTVTHIGHGLVSVGFALDGALLHTAHFGVSDLVATRRGNGEEASR